MTQYEAHLPHPLDDIVTRRADAIHHFIDTARQLLGDDRSPSRPQLERVAEALIQLGLQRELFPAEQFPFSEKSSRDVLFRLAEDSDGRLALYLSSGQPGKASPAHNHTTWAIIAGVSGSERNYLYHREATDIPATERLKLEKTFDVEPGKAITLLPDDVHSIEFVGSEPGLHLHFYGLALEHLHDRVSFSSLEGGSLLPFTAPPFRHALISPAALKAALDGPAEIAVLDVRETGVYAHGHILLAVSAPLWRLELLIDRLVPRRNTHIVLVDANESLAHQAAAKLVRLGWLNVTVLAGGTQAWAGAGFEVFTGTNVPSKALGEVVEHEKHTPWIDAEDLEQRIEQGENIVVVDSRTPEEFSAFSLPFAKNLPGAELVYRIGEVAPDPDTLIVVNCAGRTRSIIGAQTLIDAGIPNRVASLKDGTMAWLLSGRPLSYGSTSNLPEPGDAVIASARERAERVAHNAGVRRIDQATLTQFEAQAEQHTLYRFDVRTRQEYEAGHLENWRWAPGGQLVQATDEYIATRRARLVLADWDGVRALTTAAWIAQLGGFEVFVFTPPPFTPLIIGGEPVRLLQSHKPATQVSPRHAAQLLETDSAVAFDIDRRASYTRRHIRGAHFCVPDRLQEFIGALARDKVILLTSPDGVLARVVAAELQARTGHDVRAIEGGTAAWIAADLHTASGDTSVLSGDDDHWFSPYAHTDQSKRDAGFRAYLDWEVGLVAQLEREGKHDIRLISD